MGIASTVLTARVAQVTEETLPAKRIRPNARLRCAKTHFVAPCPLPRDERQTERRLIALILRSSAKRCVSPLDRLGMRGKGVQTSSRHPSIREPAARYSG